MVECAQTKGLSVYGCGFAAILPGAWFMLPGACVFNGKRGNRMEWNEKLQRVIDYVENHLQRKEEPVDPEEIAGIAGCSYPFFQKVFSYMNGISFAEYIRFRKMTLAGYDLKSTNMKVIDIGLKYGYDSPTSFTKAFQQFHGVSPKEARGVLFP